MTDFDFDVKERKNLARQAVHRKNGSKSKKCTLPSDGLTQSQWKKLNGEVRTMNYKQRISYEDFKRLPSDVATAHLEYLRDTYGVGRINIAEAMGCKNTTLKMYCTSHGINVVFPTGKRHMTREQMAAWDAFCGGSMPYKPTGEETAKETPVEKPREEEKPAAMSMTTFSVTFTGKMDVDAIANSIRHIIGNNGTGTLEMVFTLG